MIMSTISGYLYTTKYQALRFYTPSIRSLDHSRQLNPVEPSQGWLAMPYALKHQHVYTSRLGAYIYIYNPGWYCTGMGRQAGAGSSEGASGELRQSVRVGKLNLVDLAGSERVHITGAKGTSHFSSPSSATPPPLLAPLRSVAAVCS